MALLNDHSPAAPFDAQAFDASQLGRCLVTGGAGYLGSNLAHALARAGASVRTFDIKPSEHAHIEHRIGDVRSKSDLLEACEDIDTVFHTAAKIDTAMTASDDARMASWAINVEGSRYALEAAQERGATRFVYTSSVNVVVDHPIAGGDESAPYATQARDLYTNSKATAEAMVLDADRDGFRTCALRPGGIFGPGDPQHLPRVVRETLRGRFAALIGEGKARADNIYIDDLVSAHLAAAVALDTGRSRGRAYFINDGVPTNYFHFFAPVVAQLGRPFPTRSVPEWVVRPLATAAEYAASVGGPRPFLTRMELDKLVHDHFFSIERARVDLGWHPHVPPNEAFDRCREYVQQLADGTDVVKRPPLWQWAMVLGGLGLLGVLAFNTDAHRAWVHHISPMFSQSVLRAIAYPALAVHLGEAAYAAHIAQKHDLDTAGWTLQTFLLGYPSLRLLLEERDRRVADPGQAGNA